LSGFNNPASKTENRGRKRRPWLQAGPVRSCGPETISYILHGLVLRRIQAAFEREVRQTSFSDNPRSDADWPGNGNRWPRCVQRGLIFQYFNLSRARLLTSEIDAR
jgi:hypothetical protein